MSRKKGHLMRIKINVIFLSLSSQSPIKKMIPRMIREMNLMFRGIKIIRMMR